MGSWRSGPSRLPAIIRSIKSPYVDRYLRETRGKLYSGGQPSRGGSGGKSEHRSVDHGLCAPERGGLQVCDLHDQTRLPVPFFESPTPFVIMPTIIARRVGAHLDGRCLRLGKQSRFQIDWKELNVPRRRNHADDVDWIRSGSIVGTEMKRHPCARSGFYGLCPVRFGKARLSSIRSRTAR